MKKIFITCLIFICSIQVSADTLNLDSFAKGYFEAWKISQRPGATKQDLENYLTFLADDIGHQHLPYNQDDTRKVGGKHSMRKGMSYYLGLHSKYSAKLVSYTTGFNVIIIQYETHSEGIHPQSGQIITQNSNTVEVLEIDNNKVSVIRKYSE